MAEDTAAELLETRKELEGHSEDLQEMAQTLNQAASVEDPLCLTIPQIKNIISKLDLLKTDIQTAQQFLTRKETDEALSKQDSESKRAIWREIDKTRELAFCLKNTSEAFQHIKSAKREMTRLEKGQAENPHKDYSTAIKAAVRDVEAVKASINSADLAEEDELWTTLDSLEERLMALTSHEILPKDSKDIPKLKPAHKITPLVIPKFSGKVEHWRAFWDEFDHAVNKRMDLEDLTKLVYLKQSMQDLSLKSTLSDLGVSEEAYPAAIQLLEDRFNKPRILHRQNCEEMMNISRCENTRTGLTELADKAPRVLTGFKRLETLEASQVLTSIIELSMNQDLKQEWLKNTKELKKPPPAEKLIKFIRERADQAQEAEKTTSAKPSEMKNKHKPRNRGSHAAVSTSVPAVVTTPAPVTQPSQPVQNRGAPAAARITYPPCKYQCPLCPEKHYPYHCTVFRALSVSQRIAHATANSLCNTCDMEQIIVVLHSNAEYAGLAIMSSTCRNTCSSHQFDQLCYFRNNRYSENHSSYDC